MKKLKKEPFLKESKIGKVKLNYQSTNNTKKNSKLLNKNFCKAGSLCDKPRSD